MAIVDLIESGLGLLRSESDITPAWVQGVLRGSGALEDGVEVTSVSTERIGGEALRGVVGGVLHHHGLRCLRGG